MDVATVNIHFDVSRASSSDNLLVTSNVSLRGGSLGQPIISGDVINEGRREYDNIQIAVVLVDTSGNWVGFVTAGLPVRSLKAGDKAQFVTNADVPPAFLARTFTFEGFAFDK